MTNYLYIMALTSYMKILIYSSTKILEAWKMC